MSHSAARDRAVAYPCRGMLLSDTAAEPAGGSPTPVVATPVSPRALTVAAFTIAAIVGVALAVQIPAGLAILLAAGYVPLILIDMRLGLALCVPLIFLEGILALNLAGNGAGLLVVAAWLGILRGQRSAIVAVIGRHARLL